ncbi:nuclear autoantigen Sp-100-like [Protopterus annectens]|uniref:nuclear autoantigen Sp-100-like n=1 Tax=Protopterus annectens TaxID=7888 RepID=UPI001CFC2593|nr:nuclear autoantigen Sp-100-like [Protopterus annectens]
MTNTHFQLQHRRVHQQHGNKDDRMSILKNVADEQIVHFFRTNKVEISAAIDNPYPFLYSLKDHDLITEEVLEQSRNKSVTWNLNEKVYLILSEFEKSGISVIRQVMSLLWKDTNLQHYPKLKDIYSYFYKDGTNVAETPLSEVSFKTGSPDVSSSGSGPVSEPVFTDISYNTPVPDVSSSGSVSVTEMEFSEVPYSVASPDVSSSGELSLLKLQEHDGTS